MRYFAEIEDGCYLCIGRGGGEGEGEEITETEYNAIRAVINDAPEETETVGYRLKTDLTWEPFEKEAIDPGAEEVTDDEIAAAIQEALT